MSLSWWETFFLVVAATVTVASSGSRDQTGFVEVGTCESNRVCVYNYKAIQEDFEDEMQQNATVTTTVEASCDAVGEYAMLAATRYCLTFRNTMIDLSEPADKRSGDNERVPEGEADRMLAGWFCFVQTEDGKVAAVNHDSDESTDIINFKKSIAASFQANFKRTELEEEVDPQSDHISHYSYDDKGDETVYHRSISNKDVLEYASHDIPKDKVEFTKDEYITYKSEAFKQSRGEIYMKVLPEPMQRFRRGSDVPDEQQDTYDDSFRANRFSVRGSYIMDLDHCYTVPRVIAKRRRDTQDSMAKGYTENTLRGHFNLASNHLQEMKELRRAIPSVPKALLAFHHDQSKSSLVNQLQRLMLLESQYGPLTGFTPALNDVLDYLQDISESEDPSDLKMRLAIYSLLSVEGSPRSQKVLIDSLKHMTDEKERNTVITFIAFIQNPTPEFVSHFETLIEPDLESTDPQLLAYGALASSATPALQQRIVQFLQSRLVAAENNLVAVVHLIHALSNTGCNTTVTAFIGYLNHSNINVQLAAINAMRKHTNSKLVHDAFISMLNQPNLAKKQIEAIIGTLIAGLEHQNLKGHKEADNTLLLTALVSAAMRLDSLGLHQLLIHYALKLDTDEANEYLNTLYTRVIEADMTELEGNETHGRRKRAYTTYWSHSDSLYNLVSPLSTQVSDVNTYPHHKAYLWGKDLGVSDLNAKFVAGGFVGVNDNGNRLKLFGKSVAQGHAFGSTETALHCELLVEKNNNTCNVTIYCVVVGFVLINVNEERLCSWTYEWPLYDSGRYPILHVEHRIFIYVGFLTFSCGLYAELGLTAQVHLIDIDVICSASGAIVPRVTITASAAATASLLELVRGGIQVDTSLTYQLEPALSTEVCIPEFQVKNCLHVYDEWPSCYVEIYPFYQFRDKIKVCKEYGFPFPCGVTWGSKHHWNDASLRWGILSREKQAIWSLCDSKIHDCGNPEDDYYSGSGSAYDDYYCNWYWYWYYYRRPHPGS